MMHFSLKTTLELFVIIGISFWKIAKKWISGEYQFKISYLLTM